MKHFTKYLPDPKGGEIKEGDIIWDDTQEIYDVWDDKEAIPSPDKKFKLFLCSRDITFPCDIYCFAEKVWRKNCQSMSCDECIRVIGEVSPEALSYVKEGMEFDEYDWKGSHLTQNKYGEWVDEEFADKTTYYIQIKGPCGHFH